jgi:hypothetical protein
MGSGKRGNVIRSVAGECFVLVCACVAGVNKIRLKVTDGSAGSRGLGVGHGGRLHKAAYVVRLLQGKGEGVCYIQCERKSDVTSH